MEFNSFPSAYDQSKRTFGKQFKNQREFYRRFLQSKSDMDETTARQLAIESIWYEVDRPYYHVYPGIIKGFLNLRLDIPISQLTLPETAVCIKFAKGKEPFAFEHRGEKYSTKSMLAFKHPSLPKGFSQIILSVDIGEIETIDDENPPALKGHTTAVCPFFTLQTEEDATIQESIDKITLEFEDGSAELPAKFRRNLFQILASVCLLSDDVDLKEFDVLAKDLEKYHENYDPKFIWRAKRRGKNGWLIGRRCEDEKNPSYVNPHFQHYWTGKGRTQIILKHKKGFFTKRDKLKEVPTGYEDKEDN